MNEKHLLFDTPYECHENISNYVGYTLNGHKMDKNISEYVPISVDQGPVSYDLFSQYWWVVDKIKLASATGKYIFSCAG